MLMEMELKLEPPKHSPLNVALLVGGAAFIGSFIPLIPFVLLPVRTAIVTSLTIATSVLFFVGAYKSISTVGNWLRGGLEMALIGMLAALVGYGIGALMNVVLTGVA
jgi:predicted membrane protein (TIGR00267 family)